MQATQIASEELCGNAVIFFHRSTTSSDSFVQRCRAGAPSPLSDQSTSRAANAVASRLCEIIRDTCTFGSHTLLITHATPEQDEGPMLNNDELALSTSPASALIFGVYRALPPGAWLCSLQPQSSTALEVEMCNHIVS